MFVCNIITRSTDALIRWVVKPPVQSDGGVSDKNMSPERSRWIEQGQKPSTGVVRYRKPSSFW